MICTEKRGVLRILLLLFLFLILLTGSGYADSGDEIQNLGAPSVAKTLTPNGDGTYALSLSIMGKSQAQTSSTKADVIIIFDASRSMTATTGGFSSPTRLVVAKRAVNNLVDQLLDNNTAQEPDRVHLSLITFSAKAKMILQDSQDRQRIKSQVNGIQTSSGTNWEDAFQVATKIQTRVGAEKYIVFVSDGNPTQYNSGNGYAGDGTPSASNVQRCYNAAKDDALALHNAGFHFFGIGTFGDVSRMESIVKDAGEDANTNAFQASNEVAIQKAFAEIIQKILHNFGYKDVKLTDMVTSLTSLVQTSGNSVDFSYKRSGGSYGSGTTWTNAPKATFSQGGVRWDLSSLGTLENNVTYTVSFTVWPSQRAYDIVAALGNGEIGYGENKAVAGETVTNREWSELTERGELRTNERASARYTQVYMVNGEEVSATPGEVEIANPEPIPLATTKLRLSKRWEDDGTELTERPKSITIAVKADGKKYKDVVLSAPTWNAELVLSPGLMVDANRYGSGQDGVLVSGHTYSLLEMGYVSASGNAVEGMEPNYELTAEELHPMLNGRTKADSNDLIDLLTGKTWSNGSVSLTATNTRKSEIEIQKKMIGDDDDSASFRFRIKLKNMLDEPLSTPYLQQEGNLLAAIYDEDGRKLSEHGIENGEVVLSITKEQRIRIQNVPAGTKYTVSEIPSEGYSLIKQEGTSGTVSGNQKKTVRFTNQKEYGQDVVNPISITISKKDHLSGNQIPASINPPLFEVRKNNQVVGETEVLGDLLTYEFTEEGTYILKEKKPPTGYLLNPQVFEVIVSKVYDGTQLDVSSNCFLRTYHLETNLPGEHMEVEDEPERTAIEIEKRWNDEAYEEVEGYVRPAEATIVLIGTAGDYSRTYTKRVSE